MIKRISFFTILTATACDVVVPDTDATPPALSIAMFDPNIVTIASSDPNRAVPRGCPAGTSANLIDVEAYFDQIEVAYAPPLDPATFEDQAYFYRSADDATKFWVTANDPEGVSSIRAIGHAHESGTPRAYAFDTRPNAGIGEHVGDYTPSPGTVEEYGITSPFDPNLPKNGGIFSHDLRIQESFAENPDGSFSEVLKDGGVLMFAPFSLAGGPVIYASSANAADDSQIDVTRLAVMLLPQSLCRPDVQ